MNTDNLIPPGRYLAQAVDAVLGRTSTGKEQIAITFRILAPPNYEGREITYWGYFSPKTEDKTLEALENTGWDGESLAHPVGIGTIESMLVIEHETDERGTRHRVRWVNRTGGAVVKEKLDAGATASLEQRLKGKMLARRQQREANGDDSFDF
jgi:hypothetical protein